MRSTRDVHAVLLADVYHAVTGQEHPARPKPRDRGAEQRHRALAAKLRAQRARREAPTS